MTNPIPPGSGGGFLGLHNMSRFQREPLGMLLEMARNYGDVARWRFGPFWVYQVNHPDYLHDILVSNAAKYYKTRGTKRILSIGIGDGLLISDGDFWKRQRRLMQPAFHARHIANYANVIVEHTQRMLDGWQTGQERELMHEMTTLTLNIIAKVLFNADVSDEAFRIGEAMMVGIEVANGKFQSLIPSPMWLPTKGNRAWQRAIETVDSVILRIINERRASGEDKGDFLSMLLLAVDDQNGGGQMTNQQVRDEAVTLFVAGHETTALTLTWAWYLLSQHPEVEGKLMAELHSVLGGRAPTVDDLPRLPYTEMVIKETMRLYPAAWIIGREPIENVTIGRYPVKKGAIIFISPYAMHRDPRYFEDPERFMPERFAAGYEDRIPRYAYIPFGGGPRVCIGNAFAMMEASLILATVAQKFRFSLVPSHTVVPDPLITPRLKHGLKMRLALREPAPVVVDA